MMPCETALEHLDDWLDGALTEPTRLAIQSHLESCAACSREYGRHRALVDDLVTLNRIGDRCPTGRRLPERIGHSADIHRSQSTKKDSLLTNVAPPRRFIPDASDQGMIRTSRASNDRERGRLGSRPAPTVE